MRYISVLLFFFIAGGISNSGDLTESNRGDSLISEITAKSWSINSYNYFEALDEKLGWPWKIHGSSLTLDSEFRKENVKFPGYYLIPPRGSYFVDLNSQENDYVKGKLESILTPQIPLSAVTSLLVKYDNVMYDSSREEYYGRVQVKSDRFAIGGWFDKFMVVGIYKYFDNPDDFLDLARRYFQLPEIDKNKLEITEGDGPFYSYLDRENRFLLRGHGAFIVPTDSTLTDAEKKDMKMVIELIKYYDEEFMP